jgi:FixJ family two-component response regulator
VFVVDDDYRVRESLNDLLTSVGYRVRTFDSAAAYLDKKRTDNPGCLVLDLNLLGVTGLELQTKLAGTDSPPIVFISGQSDVSSSVRAMKAGAVEFLQKPFSESELLRAVHAAIALDLSERERKLYLRELRNRYEVLTPREREVLPFVVAGKLNKQTAAELGTSEITVRVHRGKIMRKMKAQSLAGLVQMAADLGIQ